MPNDFSYSAVFSLKSIEMKITFSVHSSNQTICPCVWLIIIHYINVEKIFIFDWILFRLAILLMVERLTMLKIKQLVFLIEYHIFLCLKRQNPVYEGR